MISSASSLNFDRLPEWNARIHRSRPFDLVLGRKTYEIFAAHWPHATTNFPVVVGPGKRLFSDGTIPAGLKLVDSKVSTTGVVINTYEPAGEIVTGSFALDEPTGAEIERRHKLEG
jgi:dihydrofolate reductase